MGDEAANAVRAASRLAQEAVTADKAGDVSTAVALYSRAVEQLAQGLVRAQQEEGADTSKLLRYSKAYSDRIACLSASADRPASSEAVAASSRCCGGRQSAVASGSARAAAVGPASPSGDAEYNDDDIEAASPSRLHLSIGSRRPTATADAGFDANADDRGWQGLDAAGYDDADLEAAT